MCLYVHANCYRFRGPSWYPIGTQERRTPYRNSYCNPTDSEDEIIVVDEIPPKDDPGLAKPSTSGLIPPPPSPQASNGDKNDVQMTPSQQPGANNFLTQR